MGNGEARMGRMDEFFDEAYYLTTNEDVACDVGLGIYPSGLAHYRQYGREENREAKLKFDEDLYLRRYADVVRAKKRGEVSSGLDHFLRFGIDENRLWQPANPQHQQLLASCCSLGQNCEFGVIQSMYDAHPLDLLRWAGIPVANLEHLLRERFANLGDDEQLVAGVNENGEWDIITLHYQVKWHTFTARGDVARTVLLKREAARLTWLAKKLLADLQSASRLFVRLGFDDAPRDGLRVLGLLQSFNPNNRLLWVRPSDDLTPPGTVKHLGNGLVIGYLGEFWKMDETREQWLAMCRHAQVY
jgi:hypothetical protein